MRSHEPWCGSMYRNIDGTWLACDCGAEQENAEQLAPQQSGLKRRKKTRWLGQLPDQFCVKCEQAPVKRLTIEPHEKTKPTRDFAACLSPECAHIREIQRDAE